MNAGKPRILVVDDSIGALKVLISLLEQNGYAVHPADSGRLAIAALANFHPDCILLDIYMPEIDGFKVLQHIKQNPATADIPVILISAAGETEKQLKGFSLGAVDFISKPFVEEILLARVRTWTELVRLRSQIISASHEWQITFDSISDSIALIDTNHRIIRCNTATAQLLQMPIVDVIGKTCYELMHETTEPIHNCPFSATMSKTDSSRMEAQIRGRWFEVRIHPILNAADVLYAAVHIMRDITDEKESAERLLQIQAQMAQQEKMASIGQLAAGVAHEINNPASFVKSNLASLDRYMAKLLLYWNHLEEIASGSPTDASRARIAELSEELDISAIRGDLTDLMHESREGIVRIQNIVRDLLQYARSVPVVYESVSSTDVLRKSLDIASIAIKNRVQVKVNSDFASDIPLIRGNFQKLQQVFLNLMLNALHAIPSDGGLISVANRQDGDKIVVTVSDTGHGIPDAIVSRIFDPFFTTKDVGEGTGLGLSICHGIITDHGGTIKVESIEGSGTTFTVTLPVA